MIAPGRRGIATVIAVAVVAAVALVGCAAPQPRPPEERETAAAELLAGIRVTATVVAPRFAATYAIADLGIEEGIRRVRVRIVETLGLELRIDAEQTVAFAEAPRFCLVGPFPAPDDAGLSDRCWGTPEVGALVAARLPSDAAGRPVLRGGETVVVRAELERGDVRCDYAPGEWLLEIKADPVVVGSAAGARYLPDVRLDIPFARAGPLQVHERGRFCGLAAAAFRDDSDQPTASP